jgi:hypothetical protein
MGFGEGGGGTMREGGEQGREGAGGRGRLEQEEDVVKICLTSGVQCDKGVYKSWVGVRRKTRLSNADERSLYGCIRARK